MHIFDVQILKHFIFLTLSVLDYIVYDFIFQTKANTELVIMLTFMQRHLVS
jgi:hypothetical protein